MKKILLSQGKYALVDDEDYEYLNQWNWCIMKGDKKTFYAFRKDYSEGTPKGILMHRTVMKTPDNEQVDHRDHNGLNNQKINLRNCTHKQNHGNQAPCLKKISKYKGVSCFEGRKKPWFAQITKEGKRFYKGSFEKEIDAAYVYDEMAKELFGEFAWLNFSNKIGTV